MRHGPLNSIGTSHRYFVFEFKDWLMTEMPITNFQLVGDWSPTAKRRYGYNKADIGILTSPKAVAKIHKKWSNTRENFDLWFVRTKEGYNFIELGEVGEDWIERNLGLPIKANDNAITVIFTNNRGDQKVPMTAWMIAHRMAHSFARDHNFTEHLSDEVYRDFAQILRDVYQKQDFRLRGGNWYGNNYSGLRVNSEDVSLVRALFQSVGTMRSAQRSEILRPFEFILELFAQYIITGKIRFKPLPRTLRYGRFRNSYLQTRLSDEELADENEILQGNAEKYAYYIDSVLSGYVGRIFLM